jgi:predicted AlkP superfamily phosphohydrolase/phosphomutase
MSTRLLLIGLDCADPRLVFEEFAGDMPRLRELAGRGRFGRLESTIPPITVPAWTAMVTGKDPGQLGCYGFRNRRSRDYGDLAIANATAITEPTLWNLLSRKRKECIVLGVPQTYPPKPLNGVLVGCFLTPDKSVPYTWPPEVAREIDELADGDYIIDVDEFRTHDKDRLLAQIHTMTQRRFQVVRHWLRHRSWDFFMFVEMGPDRIHHGFWRHCDPRHRLFEPGNPYRHAIRDYYRLLDREIGSVLDLAGPDTAVLVTSDHGVRGMQGGICINEWLRRRGYLVLREEPPAPTPLKASMIDWPRTRVWGEGGYYGRIFFNVQGREPQGLLPPAEYDSFRDRLQAEIEGIGDEQGRPIGTVVYRPEDIYRECRNIPPDLIVYFGDLAWRSAGSVGTGAVHIFENDTGPDDANHDRYGLYIFYDPARPDGGIDRDASIYDVAPTVLHHFGQTAPEGLRGRAWQEAGGA